MLCSCKVTYNKDKENPKLKVAPIEMVLDWCECGCVYEVEILEVKTEDELQDNVSRR